MLTVGLELRSYGADWIFFRVVSHQLRNTQHLHAVLQSALKSCIGQNNLLMLSAAKH